ncbi:enoyl-CoA hydratase/isomerase family protein [Amycolatopsis rhabdoformis]|uniref:Enoyl-CoA hydratase/isomerase family protein n=1 Tax=Amycolatopsis rhabdoformis TaxID=1448059 RepID=A0ABZ1II18_9PSEU|nr:enoyl-CoA hydratase/isomerase family protein [Amycolatopsis rhabdoformis]WSE34094.1 enoyl-CoA hydratase/isomerase family protein [Amycolatopsis rhabdoformis]
MTLVDLTFEDSIALVRLNRPDRLNALSDALLAELESTLDRIAVSPCRAIVVTGAGRAFCVGADLPEVLDRLDGAQEEILAFVRRAGNLFSRLENSPLPVIAAVNGHAVAGGFELVLAADLVIAAEGALLGDGHVRYGMLPGGGGAVRIERKLPANVARRLLFTGDLEPAERFHTWGLVEEVVPARGLLDAAFALAHRFTAHSALALAEVKRVSNAARDLPTAEALRLEYDTFAAYLESPDLRAGLTTFRERKRGSE